MAQQKRAHEKTRGRGRGWRWLLSMLSIRQRLAVWYTLLLMVILTLFSVIVYTLAANQLRSSVQEDIHTRAHLIAMALQHSQYPEPSASPTGAPTATAIMPSPTPSPAHSPTGTTVTPPVATPTPVATPDPATSAAIQKQLSLTVPDILARLDLGFEVLDDRKQPVYIAATLGASGVPINADIVDAVLRGAPGSTYTAHTQTTTLAVYVEPLVFQSPTSSQTQPNAPTAGAVPGRVSANQVIATDRPGVVIVAKSLNDVSATLDTLRQILIIGVFGAVLLATLGGWFIAESGLRPLTTVTRTARSIANSATAGLGQRVHYSGPRDEIGELVSTFNDMLASLQGISSVQRRFVADASHELRAPLTSIKGNLELLRHAANLPAEERANILDDAYAEATRLSGLVNDLLLLARVDAAAYAGVGQRDAWLDEQLRGRREMVELDQLVMDVFRQLRAQLQEQPKRLHIAVTQLEPMRVLGDPGQLRQILLILCDNAMKYTPDGGRIRVSVTHSGDWAEIAIADTGIGISADEQLHIFERFYRADQARVRDQQGSGLGLAIAKWIAEAHMGELRVESAMGQGSTFTLRLKAERRPAELTSPRILAAPGATAKRRAMASMQPLVRLAITVSRPREPKPAAHPATSKHRQPQSVAKDHVEQKTREKPPSRRASRDRRKHG